MNKYILCLFSNRISGKTGGEIEAKKIYEGINNYKNINKEFHLYTFSLDENIVGAQHTMIKKDGKKDLLSRLFMHGSFFYFEWLKNKKKITNLKWNIILVGNSRLGFVLKKLKKENPNAKIITQYHNIEYDYVDVYSLKYRGIKKVIFKIVEKIAIKKDEKSAYLNSDINIFLTKRDKERAAELYGENGKQNIVIPICLSEENIDELSLRSKFKLNLVFLGSLDYPSNKHAIVWFIKNVWTALDVEQMNIQLIIGGKNPDNELVEIMKKQKNLVFYPNFRKKEEIVPVNSVFISPIIFGAGMKVKVAEALSMGLRIIGTTETFIGYEEALMDNDSKEILKVVDNKEDFIEAISKMVKNEENDISIYAKSLFKKYYSFNRAISEIKNILEGVKYE